MKEEIELIQIKDKEGAAKLLNEIGELKQKRLNEENEINKKISELTSELVKITTPIDDEITLIAKSIKAYSDSNRKQLFLDKSKTLDLTTGTISYRQSPPSVKTRISAKILEKLKELKLKKFIRVKEELNKDIILATEENMQAAKNAGIKIEKGVERFYIKPIELKTDIEVV